MKLKAKSPLTPFSESHYQLRQYVHAHFQLQWPNKGVALNRVELEINKGNIFIYLETSCKPSLLGLEISNHLLTNSYPNQANTVNFHDKTIKGSLTFNRSVIIGTIVN